MFAAVYYNGRNAAAIDVQCDVTDGAALRIRGQGVEKRVAVERIRVSPRLARTRRILSLPDGAQIHSDDNDAVDAIFPGRNRLETWVDRLERHWRAVAASALTSAVAIVLFFAFGLPWLADRVAQKIPFAVEQAMGEQALNLLRRVALNPSALPRERQQALRARFDEFVRDIPDGSHYRLEFFAAPGVGANAFALPGGTIVFTDEMLTVLDSDNEFLAVAAHEIGHEQRRHMLRLLLRDSAVVVVGTLFAGDVSSASTLVVAIPTFLLQNHYTRGFEADADDYAFTALAVHKISPQVFADVMRKIEQKNPQLKDATMAYASTHPPTQERIRRAEEAAKTFGSH